MTGPSFASVRRRQNVRKARAVKCATKNLEMASIQRKVAPFRHACGSSEKGMLKAGVEALGVLRAVARQDFKDHPIDSIPG
jgi:hypothetical protein